MKNKYEHLPNAQVNRVSRLDLGKNWTQQLLQKDLSTILSLAFKLAKKKELTKKQLSEYMMMAAIGIGCEKLRREGKLRWTGKGWIQTEKLKVTQ